MIKKAGGFGGVGTEGLLRGVPPAKPTTAVKPRFLFMECAVSVSLGSQKNFLDS